MDSVPRSLLLDGAMSTNLFSKGMPETACIPEWIAKNPSPAIELLTAYCKAGCDIICAPTAEANRSKLDEHRLGDETAILNRGLVALAQEAANGYENVRIAGVISATNITAEPFDEDTFEELSAVYHEQISVLEDAGVDLFVINAVNSITEARVAVMECKRFDKPIFVTVSVNGKGKMPSGGSADAALIILQGLGISAFGLSCCQGEMETVAEILMELSHFAEIPLVSKPNAGEPNLLMPHVYELSPLMFAKSMQSSIDSGATILGGCCGTTPEHLATLRELIDSHTCPESTPQSELSETDMVLSNGIDTFSLDIDRLEFSPPIICQHDMADSLLEAENDSTDVITVIVETADDALQFALNAHLARLPVSFLSDNIEALERALILYGGRAIIDSKSHLDEKALRPLAKKYGAIIY